MSNAAARNFSVNDGNAAVAARQIKCLRDMIRAARLAQIGFLRGRSSVHFSHSHGYRLCRVRYGKLYGGAMDFPCTIGNWPRWPESKILSDVASDFLSFFKYTLSHASLFNYCSDPPRHPLRARHIVLPRAFCR